MGDRTTTTTSYDDASSAAVGPADALLGPGFGPVVRSGGGDSDDAPEMADGLDPPDGGSDPPVDPDETPAGAVAGGEGPESMDIEAGPHPEEMAFDDDDDVVGGGGVRRGDAPIERAGVLTRLASYLIGSRSSVDRDGSGGMDETLIDGGGGGTGEMEYEEEERAAAAAAAATEAGSCETAREEEEEDDDEDEDDDGHERDRLTSLDIDYEYDDDDDATSSSEEDFDDGGGRLGPDPTGTSRSRSGAPEAAPYSLATYRTTPRLARCALTLLILAAHGLFLYGQFAPMWRLRSTRDVDVWANATTTLSRRTFDALGLDHEQRLATHESGDVETFTYGFAVRRLWEAAGMSSKFGPRLSAVLLVLFSGAWPHVKLLLLSVNWLWPRREGARTKALYWLSALGKWSLADVLVVCVMIAVVHLDWDVDPLAIRDGAIRQLPLFIELTKGVYTPTQICDRILSYDCTGNGGIKCWACERVVDEMYGHPGWAEGAGRDILNGVQVSGGGQASLRIAGMRGIYVFCAAATLSLLIGVAIDALDHRARADTAKGRRGGSEERAPTEGAAPEETTPAPAGRAEPEDEDPVAEALVRHGTHTLPEAKRMWLVQRATGEGRCSSSFGYCVLILSSLVAAALVAMAVAMPTMERRVKGAGPMLIHEVLGIEWERKFSLRTLAEVTGEAGGPDLLLMGTFALFIIVGPVLRSALAVLDLVLPMSRGSHGTTMRWIDSLGAFCAWDVLFVSVFMVDLEMPSITNTIVMRPECALVSPEDGSCLEVEFNILPAFAVVLAGGALLLLVSTLAVGMGFRALDPYHDGGEPGGGPGGCGACRRGRRPSALRCCRRRPASRRRGRRGRPAGGYGRLHNRRRGRRVRVGGSREGGADDMRPRRWRTYGDPFAYHPLGSAPNEEDGGVARATRS